jgi:histone H3/H4
LLPATFDCWLIVHVKLLVEYVAFLANEWHNAVLSEESAVYLSGVVEYLMSELLELSANIAKDCKRRTVSSEYIATAVANDEELSDMYGDMLLREHGNAGMRSPRANEFVIPLRLNNPAANAELFYDLFANKCEDSEESLANPSNGFFYRCDDRYADWDYAQGLRSRLTRKQRMYSTQAILSTAETTALRRELPARAEVTALIALDLAAFRYRVCSHCTGRPVSVFSNVDRTAIKALMSCTLVGENFRHSSHEAVNVIQYIVEEYLKRVLFEVCRRVVKAERAILFADDIEAGSRNVDLFVASKVGDFAKMELLVGQTADPNAKYGDETALFMASKRGNIECINWLLDHGAEIDHVTQLYTISPGRPSVRRYHETALLCAVSTGHYAAICTLLDRGANIDIISTHGVTALMLAADLGKLDIVQLLCSRGANVDAQDMYERQTALHCACSSCHFDVAEQLIFAGCNCELVNRTLKSAFDLVAADKADQLHRLKAAREMVINPALK